MPRELLISYVGHMFCRRGFALYRASMILLRSSESSRPRARSIDLREGLDLEEIQPSHSYMYSIAVDHTKEDSVSRPPITP